MATFTQWNRKRPLKRISWVCGAEPVLAGEVVQAYRRAALSPAVVLFAGSTPEHEVWDLLLSYPATGGRLVVVYEADKLKAQAGFEVLATAQGLETAYSVFVSSEADFTRTGEDGKGELVPHLAVLQASRQAQLVRCCAPGKEEDLVQFVVAWWPGAGSNFAFEVLRLCGGSLQAAYWACDKARRAGLEPGPAALAAVCSEPLDENLADRIIAGDKPRAAQAALRAAYEDTGQLIGLLAARLTMLESLAELLREDGDLRDAGRRLQMNPYVLRRLSPHAGLYTAARVSRCREVLAIAESAWRAGASEGVAEAVVALW
jgi:hypothetical protein